LKHVRVYHATAHNFYPSAVFANVTTLTMANYTGYIHLCTWFSKRKERRTKAYFCFFAKHFLNKVIKRLLQVGKRNIFIYVQAFYLVELAMGPCRNSFITVNAPRRNCANGRL